MGGTRIDGRSDARDGMGYVVAWEPDVDGLTIRDPRDVSRVRFVPVAAFPTYEAAHAFVRMITADSGGGKGWLEATGGMPEK